MTPPKRTDLLAAFPDLDLLRSPSSFLQRHLAPLTRSPTSSAEFAVQTFQWCMEIYGGLGTLEESRVERCLRESMILAIGCDVLQQRRHRTLHWRRRTNAPRAIDLSDR